MPETHFEDRVALVTGGSRGLGREIALGLARAGAHVAIASRRQESCDAVAAEIEKLGRQAFARACHVGVWDDLEPLVDEVYERFGRLDILVNNAGMSPLYPSLEEVSETLFDKVIAINLKAPFRLSAIAASRMKVAGGGVILNISSTASRRPSPHAEPYGAAKAGLNALTRSLAFAYGPEVRVNAIIAGPFLTDVSKAWDMEAFEARARTDLALGRAGRPQEIVGAALHLAGDQASFTTGATLEVDGGTR